MFDAVLLLDSTHLFRPAGRVVQERSVFLHRRPIAEGSAMHRRCHVTVCTPPPSPKPVSPCRLPRHPPLAALPRLHTAGRGEHEVGGAHEGATRRRHPSKKPRRLLTFRGVVDFREQVEFGREEPPVPGRGLPPPERLRGPNLWPAEGHPPGFRARAEAFCEVMMDISWHLTRSLARSLGMPSQGFDGFIGERPHWQMKIVRYPPDRALGGRGRPLGLRLPDVCAAGRRASGLQAEVQGSPGTWMDVPPLGEDHLVVNLGEMLMLMTDGYYVATQHRVRSDPQRSRVSVPFFFNPSLAAVVKPLPADLLGRLPWERDRSLADSRRADERNAIFQDYGMNAFKSLFRSHPEVSARHHPDLELLPSGDVRLRGRPQSAAPGPVPHDRR
ncbi:unnamed protein product [Prorocentrum cordatum]|uniref:Isopenicillin N synthase-like Fe(2+) 2OG dioxygenase domain-containing protein n=1 Tax=Prorocentrum cordatum TaxID=2364126 RepID=A0ABN9PG17_9DINO|nr:unnamed protein product [Polarella glacialis]